MSLTVHDTSVINHRSGHLSVFVWMVSTTSGVAPKSLIHYPKMGKGLWSKTTCSDILWIPSIYLRSRAIESGSFRASHPQYMCFVTHFQNFQSNLCHRPLVWCKYSSLEGTLFITEMMYSTCDISVTVNIRTGRHMNPYRRFCTLSDSPQNYRFGNCNILL